jgi:hypothetical protein
MSGRGRRQARLVTGAHVGRFRLMEGEAADQAVGL